MPAIGYSSGTPATLHLLCMHAAPCVTQVSLPDAHGFVSLGVSVDCVRAGVEAADVVLAEVNPHMPRTHGDAFVPVCAIDYFVNSTRWEVHVPAGLRTACRTTTLSLASSRAETVLPSPARCNPAARCRSWRASRRMRCRRRLGATWQG